MFRYKPLTREQLQSANLIQPGTYKFKVIDVIEKKSKAGNEMLELSLEISDDFGSTIKIKDWLVDLESMHYKIANFCDSVGIDYESGEISVHQLINRRGNCEIGIEDYKTDTGAIRKRNRVLKYIEQPKTEKLSDDANFNDQIPF